MRARRQGAETSQAITGLTIIVIVMVLYFARVVLIPLALAILLSFVLAPLVTMLQRRLRLFRVIAVAITALLAFSVIAAVSWVVALQAIDLAEKLPSYRANIREKVETLASGTGGVLSRAKQEIEKLGHEVMEATAEANGQGAATTADAPATRKPEPLSVIVTGERVGPLESLVQALAPVLAPLTSAGIVIIFVIFILAQREELRDRIIRLLGEGRLTVTTQALDEAAQRVSRYLRSMLLLNTCFGIIAALGLTLIGVPNAILWGALSIPLRFIPVIGPLLAMSLPILVSLAVFDGWSMPLMTAGLFLGLELMSENVFEPWLYGSRTGISTLAILVSVLFWGWLWGPVGLVLATPLTVCLVVMGRYTTQLQFFTVLLSDEPGLPPQTKLYHRLLSMDQDAAFDVAQQFYREHSLGELYEQIMMPALALAERDRHRGAMNAEQVQFLYQSMREIVEELGEQATVATARAPAALNAAEASVPAPPRAAAARESARATIVCLPARDEADELAALMLVQLLVMEGIPAAAVSVDALAGEKLDLVEQSQTTMVCISAVPPLSILHSRYLCKRLTSRLPGLRVVVGLWGVDGSAGVVERLGSCGVEGVVTTLSDAVARFRSSTHLVPPASIEVAAV